MRIPNRRLRRMSAQVRRLKNALSGIRDIIEGADQRLLAVDGPVGRIKDELTDGEWRKIYLLATGKGPKRRKGPK